MAAGSAHEQGMTDDVPAALTRLASGPEDHVQRSLQLLKFLARHQVTQAPDLELRGECRGQAPCSAIDMSNVASQGLPAWLKPSRTEYTPSAHHPSELLWFKTTLWVVLAVSSVVLSGAIGLVWVWIAYLAAPDVLIARPQPAAAINTPAESLNNETLPTSLPVHPVQEMMAECEREAKQDPERLHLLVIPITPMREDSSVAVEGEFYDAFILIPSKSTTQGLQDGSYALNTKPFGFAVLDLATGQQSGFRLLSGVTRITQQLTSTMPKFRLGFDAPGRGVFVWTNNFQRQPGVCYWVNVRFRWH
jgi:hypothetical protein